MPQHELRLWKEAEQWTKLINSFLECQILLNHQIINIFHSSNECGSSRAEQLHFRYWIFFEFLSILVGPFSFTKTSSVNWYDKKHWTSAEIKVYCGKLQVREMFEKKFSFMFSTSLTANLCNWFWKVDEKSSTVQKLSTFLNHVWNFC